MVIIRSHDALFRFVFGEPEQVGELLRSNLPPAVAAAIDWRALRRVEGSFVDPELQERHADLLFETRLGGGPLLLFVLVEHKSADDRFTALQLLRYVVRVYDRWLAANPDASTLPPVLPLVVHHGEHAWRAPRSVRALVDLTGVDRRAARFVRRLQPDLRFLLDDLAAASEQELDERRLSAVADLCLRYLQFLRHRSAADAADHIVRWQHLIRGLLDHPRGQDVLAALCSWFLAGVPAGERTLRTAMSRIHDSDTRQTMKSALDELLDRGFAKGLERGREEGREEGRGEGQRNLLCRLLAQRFGALPDPVQTRLANGSLADVDRWSGRLLGARSLAEVFADG